MNANEVVVHEVERDSCNVVLDLLREAIGEAREAAHVHPHREILALHGCADVFPFRLPGDFFSVAADAPCGAAPWVVGPFEHRSF